MGGYETPRRLVPTPPSASNEPSSGGKTGIFRDCDFFTASDGAVPSNEYKIRVCDNGLILHHVRFELPAAVPPAGAIECAIRIETVDRGVRHKQGVVRIVVCEQALPSQRQHVFESPAPDIAHRDPR